ncbi:MAG: sigma-54-dependent transcriptional regulator [Geobacteraceae bacterium]
MKKADNYQNPILLVDDEEHILNSSRLLLLSSGFSAVLTQSDSREVLPLLEKQPVSVIVLDLHMPKFSGVELLARLVNEYPHIPVILVTANDEVATIVECMRMGAFDYIIKPVEATRLVASVRKAMDHSNLSHEVASLKQRLLSDELQNPAVFAQIATGNKRMRALFQYVEVIAPTLQPTLITGETGTGKELFARAIHDLSGCKGEFIPLNVAGLDDNMFSDTLFGHRKGAFTGAEQNREGMVACAKGGTLFLDEIGDLDNSSQVKLLRLLQEKEYYPVGSDLLRKSDARIVMATNRNLPKLIAEGKFRNDLYYRLCAHQLQIPPLRERLEDIPLLLNHLLSKAAAAMNKKIPAYPPQLVVLLSIYSFPGNVRELEGMVFDALVRHVSGILSMESFRLATGDVRANAEVEDAPPLEGNNPLHALFGHFPTIGEVEDYLINEALKLAKNNQGIAANLLGMNRQTLNKRLKNRG